MVRDRTDSLVFGSDEEFRRRWLFLMIITASRSELVDSNQVLAELSLKDPLTRLGNRKFYEENLNLLSRNAIEENKSDRFIDDGC